MEPARRVVRSATGTSTAAFRRHVELVVVSATTVVGGIEDEMHHFEVAVHHDGERVGAVEGQDVRAPWTTCTEAGRELDRLIGTPLSAGIGEILRRAQAAHQCTHLLDTALLAVRFASRGGRRIAYDAVVPDWQDPPFTASVAASDGLTLEWTVADGRIVAPPPFAGRALTTNFTRWCEESLSPAQADAAFVLRRAVWMSPARRIDLDALSVLSESKLPRGSCYSSQPERIDIARRVRGSQRDYGMAPARWLAGSAQRWGLGEEQG